MAVMTKRCIVRPLEERDYPAFVAGYENSGPARNRFDEGHLDTGFMTADWYAAMLDRRRREAEDDFCCMFHVFHRQTGHLQALFIVEQVTSLFQRVLRGYHQPHLVESRLLFQLQSQRDMSVVDGIEGSPEESCPLQSCFCCLSCRYLKTP